MIDVLRESLNMQQCIFGGVVCGDFLLVVVVWLLLQRRKASENAESKALTPSPPDSDNDGDAAKRAKEARENAEAWTRLQNYSAANAYGTEDSG